MALIVKLRARERVELEKKSKGQTPARIAKRARILVCLNEGNSVDEVAYRVGCGTATVKRIRRKYLDQGLERALVDGERGAPPRALSVVQEKQLIALACSDPPQGFSRWTISLLTEHFPFTVGRSTVHRILSADGIKPWREKNVVRSND